MFNSSCLRLLYYKPIVYLKSLHLQDSFYIFDCRIEGAAGEQLFRRQQNMYSIYIFVWC
jgi:hypothetical protein